MNKYSNYINKENIVLYFTGWFEIENEKNTNVYVTGK